MKNFYLVMLLTTRYKREFFQYGI